MLARWKIFTASYLVVNNEVEGAESKPRTIRGFWELSARVHLFTVTAAFLFLLTSSTHRDQNTYSNFCVNNQELISLGVSDFYDKSSPRLNSKNTYLWKVTILHTFMYYLVEWADEHMKKPSKISWIVFPVFPYIRLKHMMRAKEAVVFNFKIEYYYRHTYKLQKNPSAKRNVCVRWYQVSATNMVQVSSYCQCHS